jgi:hypothetical protein
MNIFIIFIFSSHLCYFDIMFYKLFIPMFHIPIEATLALGSDQGKGL